MRKKLTPRGIPTKYHENTPIDAYILARSGKTDNEIAQCMSVSAPTFERWLRFNPPLVYALERARSADSESGNVESFKDYIYNRLPHDLKRLWREIELWDDEADAFDRVEALLNGKSKRIRQHLWVHAYIVSDFNQSEACRKLNVPFNTLSKWREQPEFVALMDEINFHKKNFFEGSLVSLVKQGNTLATIFANRSQNKDRGYSEKSTVHHTVTGAIAVAVHHTFSVDKLNLPIDTRRQIRDAYRVYRQQLEQTVAIAEESVSSSSTKKTVHDLLGGDDDDERAEHPPVPFDEPNPYHAN